MGMRGLELDSGEGGLDSIITKEDWVSEVGRKLG